MKLPRWIALVGCFTLLAAFGGCGSDGPANTLTGKITRNGQPLALQPGEQIIVTVYELDAQGALGEHSYGAIIDKADGSYEVGIGPGKYRIAVQIVKAGEGDALKGKYSMSSSPLEVDVVDDMEDHEIPVTDG
jgi:hypothetical protein